MEICCIPCFWYPKRRTITKVSPQDISQASNASANAPANASANPLANPPANPPAYPQVNLIPTKKNQPFEENCLCCCPYLIKTQPNKANTKNSKGEMLIQEDGDFLCCCFIQSERKEQTIPEMPEEEARRESDKEPEKEFYFELELNFFVYRVSCIVYRVSCILIHENTYTKN